MAVLSPGHVAKAAITEQDQAHRVRLARWLSRVAAKKKRTWGGFADDLLGGLLGIGVSVVIIIVCLRARWNWLPWLLGWAVIMTALNSWIAARRVRPGLAASLVAEEICGSCGYGLAELPVDADGCVVCPECGAAWRASRMVDRVLGGNSQGLGTGAAVGSVRRPGPWERPRSFLGGDPVRRCGEDANGRLVPIVDSHLHAAERVVRRGLGPERLTTITRTARAPGSRARRWLALITLGGLAGCGVLLGIAGRGSAGSLGTGLTLIAVGTGLALVILGSEMFIDRNKKVDALVRCGVCPSCASGLENGVADGGGRVMCARCGSAWTV